MTEMKEIDIVLQPFGNNCRVLVDGESIPVWKTEILAEVNQVTRVVLHCYKRNGEPFVLKGRMVVEEDGFR
jgi:hypothetical protein